MDDSNQSVEAFDRSYFEAVRIAGELAAMGEEYRIPFVDDMLDKMRDVALWIFGGQRYDGSCDYVLED